MLLSISAGLLIAGWAIQTVLAKQIALSHKGAQ